MKTESKVLVDSKAGGTTVFSVLYEADGVIHQIGPFDTERQADTEARKAQKNGDFDIRDQRVYLMYPSRHIVEYSMEELGVK